MDESGLPAKKVCEQARQVLMTGLGLGSVALGNRQIGDVFGEAAL